MDGVNGRVAYVDLSSQKVKIESIPSELFKKFIGGRGLSAKIVLDNIPKGTEPLSSENILIFGTGPVTGTGVPGNDRTCISAISPLTGLLFNSTMGGRFGSTLKLAGYDALAIRGKADRPQYILVNGDGIDLCSAEGLVGMSPSAVLASLSTNLKDFEVCTTGIAAEHLVKYASIVHPRLNNRSGIAGRGGLGAVMASKNLKAVVAKRSQKDRFRIHSDTLLKDVNARFRTNLDSSAIAKTLVEFGTGGLDAMNKRNALGTRNVASEIFEYADELSSEKLKDIYKMKSVTCYGCPLACGKLYEINGELVKKPEFETLYALGSMVGVSDLRNLIQANTLCDEYGLDTMTMGISIAFAIECFQRGIISKGDAGGYDLRFGDGNLLLDLIEDTARVKSVGSLLAQGTRRMSQMLGGDSWKYAYQVKGLEIAAHSPRAVKTLSIGYATGTRGGSHQDARPRYAPGFAEFEGKVELAVATQNLSAVGDSLTQCRFVMEQGGGASLNDLYCDLLEAITGWRPTAMELNEIGERICNAERIFNIGEGVSRQDDILPYRVMHEEIPGGNLKGHRIPPEKLDEMLNHYYELRGWDKNGMPLSKTRERLGLAV